MEKRDLIRELQERRRNLEADIANRVAARDGLDAFLKYLAVSDESHGQNFPFPGFDIPPVGRTVHRAVRAPRTYGDGEPPATNDDGPQEMVLAREVLKAVLGMGPDQEFTQRDITERISRDYPDHNVRSASVYNALTRMANRGEIEKVRDSTGSDPAVFRRVMHTDSLQQTADNEDSAVSY